MKYNDMLSGRFLKRENRFTVFVDLNGRTVIAHMANSGRLRELLVPGRKAIALKNAVPWAGKKSIKHENQKAITLSAYISQTDII
ncbi:hypothetical protein J7K93_12190 [bacterium]|nr:hypothetical protein [bacterium]